MRMDREVGCRKVKTLSAIRSALVIIGGGLVAMPASALELGEFTIQSALGQPLSASIPYSLAQFEAISEQCVTVQPARGANRLPAASRASLLVADGTITITGTSIVREPLITMRVAISCKYTPRLTRDFVLFVDPAGATPIAAPTPDRVVTRPRLDAAPARPAAAAPPRRTIDRITVATPSPSPAPTVDTVAEPVLPTEQSTVYESPTVSEVSPSPVAELRPGDVIIQTDNPYVEPVEAASNETVVSPTPTSTSPSEPVAVIRQPQSAPGSATTSNWMLWLSGGAGAIVLALLLLGGRIRKHFGSSPIAPATPKRDVLEYHTETVAALGDVDIVIDDDSPTAENPALDVDLLAGTGLQDGNDVDVAQDFGFAATTELDLELLPEEMTGNVETLETDIMPPLHADDDKILDNEVLADDDDYDFSVMVDATNMPDPDDVTQRDLEAIEVDDDDETLIGNDYTVSKEVDYKIVEQDYEDEMTATQALNEEILNATTQAAANEASKDDKKTG
jgi:hypothetical protein